MDDWLVSVVRDDKVVELYYSEELQDMQTIRALHKGCKIEAARIGDVKIGMASDGDVMQKLGSIAVSRRVRCVETGKVYLSAAECSADVRIKRWNIYKAIQNGIAARGLHFEYVSDD